ncbi:MAG: ATP-binding protein [Deltaproteobacteria bacterium]|nr:ATP-binding protein [Deltaproteobacteria bacterium]
MKTIPRIYDSYFQRSLAGPLITVLLGPRQTGKTTTVNSFLEGVPPDRKFYLNLDSSFERDRVAGRENYLTERIEETLGFKLERLEERFYLFVDEAQKLPLIFEIVKMLSDRYSRKLKIILTGSSSLELLDKTAETLAGRIQFLRVYPFTLSEAAFYEGLGEADSSRTLYDLIFSGTCSRIEISRLIERDTPQSPKKKKLVDRLLTRSLFPPTFSRIEEPDIPRWLSDYIDTYVERDMRSLKDIGNIEGYRRVVAQLAARVGGLLDFHALAADAGVNQITAKKYVTIWQESLIGFLLAPFFLNLATRIKKSKKVYFFDNALSWALSGFKDRRLLEAGGESGHYFENLMVSDFLKWGANREKPAAFNFWEKSSVSEIDLVISTQGLTIPVEIKYSQVWDKKYLQSIRMFKEKHREKNLEIPFSLIVYRGDFMVSEENVYAIPAWAFS